MSVHGLFIYYTQSQTVFFCVSLLDFIGVSVDYLAVALSPFAICEKSLEREFVFEAQRQQAG